MYLTASKLFSVSFVPKFPLIGLKIKWSTFVIITKETLSSMYFELM